MVVLEAAASSLRREPQSFQPMPSYLGLYDFEGSPLHRAIGELWPGCLVLADERL